MNTEEKCVSCSRIYKDKYNRESIFYNGYCLKCDHLMEQAEIEIHLPEEEEDFYVTNII